MAKKEKEALFKCPKCSCVGLEVVEINVTASSPIHVISEDGNFHYGKPNIEGGEVGYFGCEKCGFELKDEKGNQLTEHDEVVAWCRKNCKQE